MSNPSFVFTIPAQLPPSAPPARLASPLAHKALWLISLGLLANAAVMLYTHVTGRAPDLVLGSTAFGQNTPSGQLLGARGIYMMPAQLGPTTFGLYLLDVDSNTICVYKALPDTSHLRLMAARTFQYDRFLTDFNNDPLAPRDVQKLVESQRQRQELQAKGEQATVDQTPKPDENLPEGAAAASPPPIRDPK